jgi:hypothetical protein
MKNNVIIVDVFKLASDIYENSRCFDGEGGGIACFDLIRDDDNGSYKLVAGYVEGDPAYDTYDGPIIPIDIHEKLTPDDAFALAKDTIKDLSVAGMTVYHCLPTPASK